MHITGRACDFRLMYFNLAREYIDFINFELPLVAYTTLHATLREESIACNYLYWEVKWLLNG